MVQFQKLTRNLFLTLHGQNVHRQQWQLSKFRMHYRQFAFHAYCGATSVSKMAPQQEKAFCVWDEFDYRVDVCRVTQDAHIEGLWLTYKKLVHLPLLTVYVLPV